MFFSSSFCNVSYVALPLFPLGWQMSDRLPLTPIPVCRCSVPLAMESGAELAQLPRLKLATEANVYLAMMH